jgi:hypothetical protein
MKTTTLAALERAINDCLESEAGTDRWPEGYQHPELVPQMAKAASMVFDANFMGQAFADQEKTP